MVEDLLDVIDLHTNRAWAIRDAWHDGVLDVPRALDEIGDSPDVMAELADRLDDPIARAIADVRRARVLGFRWFIGREVTDLHNAVYLMTNAVFLVPDGYPLQVEDLELFGDLCLMQNDHEPSLVPVDHAVLAAEKAIALTPEDDPALPEHHSRAALLLLLKEDARQRDRIIGHLAGAAKADDPRAWARYASGLRDRGRDNGDVTDLLSAAAWYRRAAEHPAMDDTWSTWALFVDTHYRLHELGQGPRHADIVIDCGTELLARPSSDTRAVLTLHRYRLVCAFQDGERPFLATFLSYNPFVRWLTDAEEAVSGAVGTDPDAALLAATVGLCWMWAIGEAPHLAAPASGDLMPVLARAQHMFGLAQRGPDRVPELDVALGPLAQLIGNRIRARRVHSGR